MTKYVKKKKKNRTTIIIITAKDKNTKETTYVRVILTLGLERNTIHDQRVTSNHYDYNCYVVGY